MSKKLDSDVHTIGGESVKAIGNKKKATFNLSTELHRQLKIAAAMHGREMVDLVEQALTEYLAKLQDSNPSSK